MITICPHRPNENNLLLALMEKYPRYVEDFLAPRLKKLLRGYHLATEIHRRQSEASSADEKRTFDMLRRCWTADEWQVRENATAECHLAHALLALKVAVGTTYQEDEAVESFLNEQEQDSSGLSLAHLEAYLGRKFGVGNINAFIWGKATYGSVDKLVAMYNVLFALPKEDEDQRLRDLSEFAYPETAQLDPAEVRHLLAYMGDWEVFSEHECSDHESSSLGMSVLLELISLHLGTNSTEEASNLLNYYSYDLHTTEVLKPLKPLKKFPCLSSENISTPIIKLCNTATETECKAYCHLILGNPNMPQKVKEIYDMALDKIGRLEPGNPHSLLPFCKDYKGELATGCWQRELTEFGLCYSTISPGVEEKITCCTTT